ncbi:glycosyltransferase family 2 protein [Candidatus Margulisiibacteriota bacterium]
MPKATIVVPAYNEEEAIRNLLTRLQSIRNDYEVIFIDDGSTDKTAELINASGFRVVRQPYNKGYGAALKKGFRIAGSDIVVIMDADGQHNPEEVDKLIKHIGEYDMVVGARDRKSLILLWRKPLKYILNLIANYLAGVKIPDLNSGFRAMRKDVVMRFMHILPNGFSFSTTITLAMLKGGYSVKYLPITTNKRIGRKSNVNFIKDGARTLLMIIRAIALFNPLKVFIPISFFLFIGGLLFSVYGFVAYHRIPQVGVISIISSVTVFLFGVLADQFSLLRWEQNERNRD